MLDDGKLQILGRADGAINTGGYKVLPEEVEMAICQHVPGAQLAFAAGVKDPKHPEYGESIGALVVLHGDSGESTAEITTDVRESMRGHVGRSLLPRRAWAVDELPTIGPGKIDRQQAAAMLREYAYAGDD